MRRIQSLHLDPLQQVHPMHIQGCAQGAHQTRIAYLHHVRHPPSIFIRMTDTWLHIRHLGRRNTLYDGPMLFRPNPWIDAPCGERISTRHIIQHQ